MRRMIFQPVSVKSLKQRGSGIRIVVIGVLGLLWIDLTQRRKGANVKRLKTTLAADLHGLSLIYYFLFFLLTLSAFTYPLVPRSGGWACKVGRD